MVMRKRRVAAHSIVYPDGKEMEMGMVLIEHGIVTGCRPLQGEPPFTEWVGGTIKLKTNGKGQVTAYKNQLKIE